MKKGRKGNGLNVKRKGKGNKTNFLLVSNVFSSIVFFGRTPRKKLKNLTKRRIEQKRERKTPKER